MKLGLYQSPYFDIYLTRSENKDSKLTGYYTPEVKASITKNGIFNHPLYLTKPSIKVSKPDFAKALRKATENRDEQLSIKARRSLKKKLDGYTLTDIKGINTSNITKYITHQLF